MQRAAYLLKLVSGLDPLAEDTKSEDTLEPAFTMEIFEIREEIEDAQQATELDAINVDIQTRFDDEIREVNGLFVEERHQEIVPVIQRMKYWQKIMEEIDSRREMIG